MASDKPNPDKTLPDDGGELTANPAVDDFFSRMNYDMRRPKPGQEAVSAALQAIQRLGVQTDSELDLEPGTCHACGNANPEGNKFCATCGVPLPQTASSAAFVPVPEAAAPVVPTALPQGLHSYHHHYHHHYFAGEGNATPMAQTSVGRETVRARVPSGPTGATLSRAEAAVRKVTQDWALACNTTHLDDLVELYTADALMMRPNVSPIKGTASIREFLFSVLDAGLGEVELEPLRTEIFGDVAFEAGRCKMLVPTTAGKRREERGKYMVVLTRQAGEWKIIADTWSSDLSMGAEVSGAKSEAVARPSRKL